ncbi:MAG: rhodanese-like domain-containing protein [Geobacteraceae bacterium]|nr:rhodanese-like domain-containing protein [Geobacteraceae bacterium]
MFKKLVISALILTHASLALAANYIGPDELKQMIQQQKDVVIVDIQPPGEFQQHYLKGSIETNAFPAKNPDEKQRLDKTLTVINASTAPVVIVCPRGGSGAKNSYEYLQSRGIPEERLLILKGGIAGWPYQELLQHTQ